MPAVDPLGSRRPPGDGLRFFFHCTECDDYDHRVMSTERRHLDHLPPCWVEPESCYFITVCAEPRGVNHLCRPSLAPVFWESISYRHRQGVWFCHLAVFMPDHVHFLLSFSDISSFSLIIGDWKRWLTLRCAISWQENFFDHRLRREESFKQKAEYILHNPVRAGLVQEAKDWPYVWIPK